MKLYLRLYLLIFALLSTDLSSAEKMGSDGPKFQVTCGLASLPEGGDDKFRFFSSVDIMQGKNPRDVHLVATHVISGPRYLASALSELLASAGSDTLQIQSGLAEFSHNEAVFEFLSERSLGITLGMGIVLLQDNKIVGQCMKFTH